MGRGIVSPSYSVRHRGACLVVGSALSMAEDLIAARITFGDVPVVAINGASREIKADFLYSHHADRLDRWVRKHCDGIFEQELWAWCRDADWWPRDRGYRTFRAWFSVDAVEMVIDLGREPIQTEVL